MKPNLTAAKFDRLVRHVSPELMLYLVRFLRDHHLAEDVLQEVWIKAHKHYDPARPPRPWLYRVAANAAVDLCRRNRQRTRTYGLVEDPISSEPDPADALETKQQIEWARRAIAALPPHLRGTLEMIIYEGRTFMQTAQTTGVPLGTVKSRMAVSIPDRIRRYGSK